MGKASEKHCENQERFGDEVIEMLISIVGVLLLCGIHVASAAPLPVSTTVLPTNVITYLNSSSLAKFNTKNLPNSLGLDIDVYYPECMKFEKGGFQTHTVGKTSYEWDDYRVLVQIATFARSDNRRAFLELKRALDANMIEKTDLKDLIPNNMGMTFILANLSDNRT